jgi:hypothetical protein
MFQTFVARSMRARSKHFKLISLVCHDSSSDRSASGTLHMQSRYHGTQMHPLRKIRSGALKHFDCERSNEGTQISLPIMTEPWLGPCCRLEVF